MRQTKNIWRSTTFVLAVLLIGLFLLASPQTVPAGAGPSSAFSFSASPSSAPADGTSKITINVTTFWYLCNYNNSYASDPSQCDDLDPPGYSGNTKVAVDQDAYISVDSGAKTSVSTIQTNASGKASFYVTSSKIGTYKVYAKSSNGFVHAQKTITFTDPSPSPPPPPPPAPTPAPVTQAEPEPPETPSTKLVDAEGNEIKPKEGQDKITFSENDPIVLTGTTVPNGEVKLYIFSEPQEATVQADDKGVWSYTIESIEPGDHRVEAEVTDPATGKTSERDQVLAFAVAQAEPEDSKIEEDAGMADSAKPGDSNSAILYVITGLVVLIAAGFGWFFWSKRRKDSKASSATLNSKTMSGDTSSSSTTDTDTSK